MNRKDKTVTCDRLAVVDMPLSSRHTTEISSTATTSQATATLAAENTHRQRQTDLRRNRLRNQAASVTSSGGVEHESFLEQVRRKVSPGLRLHGSVDNQLHHECQRTSQPRSTQSMQLNLPSQSCESSQQRGVSRKPDVSPLIMRKTQERLHRFNVSRLRTAKGAAELPPEHAEGQSADSSVSPCSSPRKLVHQKWLDLSDACFPEDATASASSPSSTIIHSRQKSGENMEKPSTIHTVRSTGRFPFMRFIPKPVHSSSTSTQDSSFGSSDLTWKPIAACTWHCSNGNIVHLVGTNIQCLSIVERAALQELALRMISTENLVGNITRPKDCLLITDTQKRHKIKKKSHTVGIVEKARETAKTKMGATASAPTNNSQVFGVSLDQCIRNDVKNADKCKSVDGGKPGDESQGLLNVQAIKQHRLSGESNKSSLSDQFGSSSLESSGYISSNAVSAKPHEKGSKASLNTDGSGSDSEQTFTADRKPSASTRPINSGSDENLPVYLQNANKANVSKNGAISGSSHIYNSHVVQIPLIVKCCIDFLVDRGGLTTEGIFRVPGSKTRCEQIRNELDAGNLSILANSEDEIKPADVATLLKQYFRDLPNPLLTKELYPAFVAAGRLAKRVETIKCLVQLLPPASCDTLHVLLLFLKQVAEHSLDTLNDAQMQTGNKMDTRNLALVFGPTIMRESQSGVTKIQNQSIIIADNEAIVNTVQTMIENCNYLFMISKEIQHETYKIILDSEAEALDQILNRVLEEQFKTSEDDKIESVATVHYSEQEQEFPEEVTRAENGDLIVKTKQISSHRIVYTLKKRIDNAGSSGSSDFPDSLVGSTEVEEKPPDFTLYIDDTSETGSHNRHPDPLRLQVEDVELLQLSSRSAPPSAAMDRSHSPLPPISFRNSAHSSPSHLIDSSNSSKRKSISPFKKISALSSWWGSSTNQDGSHSQRP